MDFLQDASKVGIKQIQLSIELKSVETSYRKFHYKNKTMLQGTILFEK